MKIDAILLSSNDNPKYYLMYDYCKELWEKLIGCKCYLIFIGEKIPIELEKYKEDIFLYNPPLNINTAFIAQNIRLLYPCLMNIQNGILIGDVDSIPMNNTFFQNKALNIENDTLLYYSWDPNTESTK